MTRAPAAVLASLGAPNVLVVGDLMLDRYLRGAVERISPEAPIQVLRVEGEDESLGGAGSVARNLAVLGARVRLVGAVGDDAEGRSVAALAHASGVELRAPTAPGRPTTVKTRHMARRHSSAQQLLRVDREDRSPVSAAVETAVRDAVLDFARDADAVLVSDYGKGLLGPALLRATIEAARARGRPVVVDPKGSDYARYRGATGLTPNRSEAGEATGLRIESVDDARRAARRLRDDLDLDFALVTLDRDGLYLLGRDGVGLHVPTTTPREVFDVTGAGDVVLAVVGLVLAAGGTIAEAAELANVAAGLEVERLGAVPVTRAEVAERLAEGQVPAAAKVLDRSTAAAAAERLRASGRRVVFTNGCFDVLHAGHVRYLRFARAQGDALFVGLNADASVTALKGPGRPVNPVADRVAVLAGLADVDHVVVFEEPDPAALVRAIAPDVLVKGEDWRDRGVVGRDVVEARGGRVVLAPLLAGRSTTAILARAAAAGDAGAAASRPAKRERKATAAKPSKAAPSRTPEGARARAKARAGGAGGGARASRATRRGRR